MKVGELRDTRAIEALRKKEREKVMRRALALILGIMLTLGSVSAMCEGPVEIEFWHYFESSNDKVMVEQRVEEYNRIQSRVHINANYVSRQEMMRRYAIGAISGELPDIGMVDSPIVSVVSEKERLMESTSSAVWIRVVVTVGWMDSAAVVTAGSAG